MGFGLNVQLVFNSALNIVQLFTDAAVVTVVQHCYTLTHRSADGGILYGTARERLRSLTLSASFGPKCKTLEVLTSHW